MNSELFRTHATLHGLSEDILKPREFDDILLGAIVGSIVANRLEDEFKSGAMANAVLPAVSETYDVVMRDGSTNGLVVHQGFARAAQQVFEVCNGTDAPVGTLLHILRRLHQLRLQPFTQPFVQQLAVRAKTQAGGWGALLTAANIALSEWSTSTLAQRAALDQELKYNFNDERQVAN